MKDDKTISRREFLKRFGLGAALTTAALTGCAPKQQKTTAKSASEPEAEKMTYRTTPTTGDKVSLLGYGCMRWPLENQKDRNSPIDQEATNALVDYAIEHGVNYFDTAPAYCDGECERVTGIALNRHPRGKWFIAAKISNLEKHQWSREESMKMYENSFKELQPKKANLPITTRESGKVMD